MGFPGQVREITFSDGCIHFTQAFRIVVEEDFYKFAQQFAVSVYLL